MEKPAQDITQLLSKAKRGESASEEELLEVVYGELRRIAAAVFSGQRPGHTLQPTVLVHEAWMRLVGHLGSIEDRQHFFLLAGKAMRQVISNHARGRKADKRGGERHRVTLDSSFPLQNGSSVDLLDLDDSLSKLAERNERHATVAELRLFSGLSIQEAAQVLGVSPRTVDSDWAMAKAWLTRALTEGS